MSHYSEDPSMVRVDFFKESGKWYCTEAVKWTGKTGWVHDPSKSDGSVMRAEFAKSLRDHLRHPTPIDIAVDGHVVEDTYRLTDMRAVCLEPYHKNSHPICMMVQDAIDYDANTP